MIQFIIHSALAGGLVILEVSAALAAPDWERIPKRDIHVFHPGATPIEWASRKSDHSGIAGMRKGETCIGCHEEKNGALNLSYKRLAGKELEPRGGPKTMHFPVSVQAAYDATNLYLRLSFEPPSGGADKGDKDNVVKATVLFADAGVPQASQYGCWQSCHADARTMPGADGKKTKYVAAGSYELMQWASKGNKVSNGSVASERKMSGGPAGAKAEAGRKGNVHTVTFTRRNPGEGKAVPFGVAIHADHASGRFHHVSLGYMLGIGAEGDVKAARQ